MRKISLRQRYFVLITMIFLLFVISARLIEQFNRNIVDLPSEADLKAFVDTYATVYDLDPRQVRRELTSKTREDNEGHTYHILLHNDIPLMVRRADSTATWEEATPYLCGKMNKEQIYVYTTVDIAESFSEEVYKKTYAKFSGIDPSGGFLQSGLTETTELSEEFLEHAASEGIPLRVHTSFFHQVIEEEMGNNPTPEQVNAFVDNHVLAIFNRLETYRNKIPSIEIIFANEPKWMSRDTADWEESPLYSTYGEDWPVEVYIRLYSEAKKRGYFIGTELKFMFNDFGIGVDNPNLTVHTKADMVREHVMKIKSNIADRLDVQTEDINMIIGFQGWASFGEKREEYYFFLDGSSLVAMERDKAIMLMKTNIEQFADAVDPARGTRPVKITEIGTYGASEDDQAEYISRWVSAIKESGRSDSIGFWTPLRKESLKKGDNLSLFNVEKIVRKESDDGTVETIGYMPRKAYYALNAALLH